MDAPPAPVFSPTEAKIIEAFLELSERVGPGNVTLQKVAAHAKVAFGTVRYHFAGPKKLDLTQAAVFHVIQQGQRYIEDYIFSQRSKPHYDGVEIYIRGTFQWVAEMPSYASFLFYFYYLSTTKVKMSLHNSTVLERARSRVVALLYESAGRGAYAIKGDAKEIAYKIHSLLAGGILAAITDKTQESHRTQLRVVLEGTRTLMGKQALRTSK